MKNVYFIIEINDKAKRLFSEMKLIIFYIVMQLLCLNRFFKPESNVSFRQNDNTVIGIT